VNSIIDKPCWNWIRFWGMTVLLKWQDHLRRSVAQKLSYWRFVANQERRCPARRIKGVLAPGFARP
jgi:hypothetical protein